MFSFSINTSTQISFCYLLHIRGGIQFRPLPSDILDLSTLVAPRYLCLVIIQDPLFLGRYAKFWKLSLSKILLSSMMYLYLPRLMKSGKKMMVKLAKINQMSEDELSDVSDNINIDEPYVSGDFELLDDTEKLYTLIQLLALWFSWFCSSPGTSKESFSRLLHILNMFLLPDGNSLPESYAKALTTSLFQWLLH